MRDKETGKSKGFAFLKYEDQRSTDLAVDNLGGATILGRTLRVDHTRYKKRDGENDDEFDVSVRVSEQAHKHGGQKGSKHHRRHRELEGGDSVQQIGVDRYGVADSGRREQDEEDPMKDYLTREKERRRVRRERDRDNR